MNQNQHSSLRGELLNANVSKYSMKMFATIGYKGDPIVMPSICLINVPLKLKKVEVNEIW